MHRVTKTTMEAENILLPLEGGYQLLELPKIVVAVQDS